MEETVDLDVVICDVVGVVDEAVEVETEVRVKVGSPRRLLVPEPRVDDTYPGRSISAADEQSWKV